MACGMLVPWPGIEQVPLHWEHRVLTTGLPDSCFFILIGVGTTLAVQWLRLQASTGGGTSLIPSPVTKNANAVPCNQEKMQVATGGTVLMHMF